MTNLKIGSAVATPERPLIAVPVMGETVNDVLVMLEQANESQTDVIEWRVDHLTDPGELQASQMQTIAFNADKPLIITWRTTAEGGQEDFDSIAYHWVYQLAIASRVAAVDVEVALLEEVGDVVEDAQSQGITVIGSRHYFDATPADLDAELQSMVATPVDVVKLAVMPNDSGDVQQLLDATKVANQTKPLITMAMGELGQRSRFEGYQYGSQLTFASLGESSAPGQPSVTQLKAHFE
ncbi:type I 3-dehydroquinate dehydratase [Weissella confusa]|uniref:type I 3-dehydroquinate dehydratase n=1 Tax=Weissella confusa TaxID=1583 RepID=UPI0018F13F3D|nr:type I 3-dehydroquinate dehydratase [Weissella confusa]MBJ7617262.1 type I 3-dehydroquinate dehydratase [Weissella confusa]MBJ7623686.1 type I 3-dehydroquinate dehydratase [Weissella confusa]MBJ7648828.1 type I 3-dehydroquinate dehydratase [Weissella confusa]MBJ7650652.1 type I 3-dehydroquinate dehydratase [Weissella confusa]MBJ7660536.1 type I 3-dehydroquinate dehydratase [Weissella confusa]